jgi:hypothetical protein
MRSRRVDEGEERKEGEDLQDLGGLGTCEGL